MTPLTLSGVASAQITLSAEANTLRAQALAASTAITAVHDAMDSEACTDALRLVSKLVREVEDARTEAKAPVLALGKQIDKLAKEFSERLTAEKIRLERLNGGFLALQEAKAEAARKIAEAEAAKRLREAAYAAEDAAAKPSAESFAKADAAEAAATAAHYEAEAISAVRPAGVRLRKKWEYEVTDIKALYEARPDLCEVIPNAPNIRAQIPHNQNIPGLRVWMEESASVTL